MISYDKLLARLHAQGLSKSDLVTAAGLSSATVARITKGEKLSNKTLQKIADLLQCSPAELYSISQPNPILSRLREEKGTKVSGGLYYELQIRMTYNSNHIEGSRLSEEQTRSIFETNTIDFGDAIPVDDILETIHHFRAIDYVIDHEEEGLSEELIKELHFILEHDTTKANLSWFAVGEYKKRPNTVGGRETAKPGEVSARMKALLSEYERKETIRIEDIIAFHADFEFIHPFQDGNGRVGRLIVLKECLRHNIVPFIIEDTKKFYYYRGLSRWPGEKGWLTDTCLDGQDTFKRLLEELEVESS
jgi:DNA-binding Xre family transcriptional regulator